MGLIDEIREQPEAMARALQANREAAGRVAAILSDVQYVVVAARGSSDNAGRYAQYLWGTRNGVPVALTTPSLFSIYDSPPRLGGALVVGISQSGESPDIVAVLAEGRAQGRPTLAVTNRIDSPLAAQADLVLDLSVGEERAVAATKTYTAELAVIALVSALATGEESDLLTIPDEVRRALAMEETAAVVATGIKEMKRAAVLARGYNQSTAFEWALKLQELSYVVAQAFSSADFLHGPIAVLEPGYPVLAVAARGPANPEVEAVLRRCREAGARVTLISNEPRLEGFAADGLGFGADVAEWLSPIPAIVLAQLLTYHLTLAKGLDPDAPRLIGKVTRTQ